MALPAVVVGAVSGAVKIAAQAAKVASKVASKTATTLSKASTHLGKLSAKVSSRAGKTSTKVAGKARKPSIKQPVKQPNFSSNDSKKKEKTKHIKADPGVTLAVIHAGTQQEDGSKVLETKDYNLQLSKEGQLSMSHKETGQSVNPENVSSQEQKVLDRVGQKGREKYGSQQKQAGITMKPPVAKQRPVALKR